MSHKINNNVILLLFLFQRITGDNCLIIIVYINIYKRRDNI